MGSVGDFLKCVLLMFVGGFTLGVSTAAFKKNNHWGCGFWFMVSIPFIVLVGKMFV